MGENKLFLAASFAGAGGGGEWEDDGRNPKWIKKLLLGAEFYVTIQLEGFSTQSQVLLASIVEGNEIYFLLTKRLSSVLYS